MDRVLLIALAAVAGALLAATPQLIKPYSAQAPWFESSAMFPRFALAMAVAGALGELLLRWRGRAKVDSDELDASESDPRRALATLALFVGYALLVPVLGFLAGTALFAGAAALVLGLSWRAALALAVPLALVLWAVFAKALQVGFPGGLLP